MKQQTIIADLNTESDPKDSIAPQQHHAFNDLGGQIEVLRVAVPTPLRRLFDYLPNPKFPAQVGSRVQISFGRQKLVGVVTANEVISPPEDFKLKQITQTLEEYPLIQQDVLELVTRAANYYHAPVGDMMHLALPAKLRKGESASPSTIETFSISTKGKTSLKDGGLVRAPKQLQAMEAVANLKSFSREQGKQLGVSGMISTLVKKDLLEKHVQPNWPDTPLDRSSPLPLTDEQATALAKLEQNLDSFKTALIEGVTGSGKTELYLQLAEKVLKKGRQVLLLVPEIGLTPQTFKRFESRLGVPMVMLHSNLTDQQRLDHWLAAKEGKAKVVLATRSGIFTPFPNLGLIMVDEEHDGAFKQQDGIRFSARDLAILRGQQLGIPVVLGSATPTLESLNNGLVGKYQHIKLSKRATDAKLPSVQLIDLLQHPINQGLSDPVISAIQQRLDQGQQAMIFLNRRGYAPALSCEDCGWLSECPHCSSYMTLHRNPPHLHCHHCDHQSAVPRNCPSCKSTRLGPVGQGTERLEEQLGNLFPSYPVIRVDRDTTQRKEALNALLDQVNRGDPAILVGTQMLAKGHHFPKLTLVVMMDIDGALYQPDFRGREQLAQLFIQVAGRSGREEHKGDVMIQTRFPDHPFLSLLAQQNYGAIAAEELEVRKAHGLPPFSNLALLRTDGRKPESGYSLLKQARNLLSQYPNLKLVGPLPSPMEMKSGWYRYQLQIFSADRRALHHGLGHLAHFLENQSTGAHLRWHLDVDPIDLN